MGEGHFMKRHKTYGERKYQGGYNVPSFSNLLNELISKLRKWLYLPVGYMRRVGSLHVTVFLFLGRFYIQGKSAHFEHISSCRARSGSNRLM